MNDFHLNIEIPDNGIGSKGFSAEFDRVNVILGANGAGKSQLLNQLRNHVNSLKTEKSLIYVEGGRTLTIPNSLARTSKDFNDYRTFEVTEQNYKRKKVNVLTSRVKDALILLEQTEQRINNRYVKVVNEWHENGQNSPFPKKPTPPLIKLFEIFNEVFPKITLSFDDENKVLKCLKEGNLYHPSSLSDGEKQIFCLIADIVLLAEENSLILVDEPEVNLNPGLACRFWDIVEQELFNSIFIYATHSISFAMRESVNQIVVLGKTQETNTFINDISDIAPSQLNELLGAIPAILSCDSALAIEGNESSFDQVFYRWLLDDKQLEIIPVGSCEDVKSISKKVGIWDKIAPSVQIKGVIDSDYKTASDLDRLEDESLLVLDYHEVESYLCNPKMISELASKLSVLETIPDEEEIKEVILNEFKNQLFTIAAKRTFSRGKIKLGVSVEKKVLGEIRTFESLKHAVSDSATLEQLKAEQIGKDSIIRTLEEEFSKCQQALQEVSIPKILRLIPGKQLLNKLAPKTGCKSARNMANAVKKHIVVSDYPELLELQQKLNALFSFKTMK